MRNYNKKLQKIFLNFNPMMGFTILETIVALAIVSLVIAGVFTAVRTGLVGSVHSKDEVKAFYLAQEAIEILRNKRDTNKLLDVSGTPTDWLEGIIEGGTPCSPGNPCRVDATDMSIANCGGGGCGVLCQNTSSFLYGHNGGTCSGAWIPTKYTREIQIFTHGADEVEVVITVEWSKGTQNQELKVKTLLMNWR